MNRKIIILGLSSIALFAGAFFLIHQEEVATSQPKASRQRVRLPSSVNHDSKVTIDNRRALNALNFSASLRGFGHAPQLEFRENSLVNIGRDYELSLEFRATSYGRYSPALGERVSMINGFVIYRPVAGVLSIEEARRYDDQSFPIVKGLNNSMVGLLTGRLIVKCMDPSFDVEGELGAKLIYRSEGLGVTYLKIPEGTDLIEFYENLGQHDQIDRADLEILQGGISPR